MVSVFTKDNFSSEVENGKGTVVVDFYADWCGPCRMMGPVIDEIANENQNIKVGKVNCDDESDIARKYGVMSIPTILVFKDGEIINKFIGVTEKDTIVNATK